MTASIATTGADARSFRCSAAIWMDSPKPTAAGCGSALRTQAGGAQWNNGAPAGDPAAPRSLPPRNPVTPDPAAVDAAITSRRAVRAFLPTPVPRSTLQDILAVASHAPSGTNTQPWKVYVLTGASKAALSRKIVAVFDDPQQMATQREEYAYYPQEWVSPYIDRRRKVGWDMYGLLGIAKGDRASMHAQHRQNFLFFGAPVGLVFTIDRSDGAGQLARLRHVRAERDGRGARPGPRYLPAGCVSAVPSPDHRTCRRAAGRDARLRHVARPRRSRRGSRTPSSPNASRWPGSRTFSSEGTA